MMLSTLLTIGLVINELMSSNVGEAMSPATNFDSWIELYNPTDQSVNLAGMYLSNAEDNLTLWQMPADVGTVPANGFLVVWLGSNDIKPTQAPFKLDCDGGTIYLSDKDGQLVASEIYPEAMSGTSYARTTDGGSSWSRTANATPGATNTTSTFATERLAAPEVSVGSKLFTGSLSVNVNIPQGARLMYTTDGSTPTAPKPDNGVANPWTQWVKNGDCEGTDATCFVCRDGNGNGDVNRITDGVGYNGSRGIKVHSVAGAANDWTTQFFVYTPDHVWSVGQKYRFSMRVRADKACSISVQSHSTPGSYISGDMLGGNYNVTTEWQTISYEGEITERLAVKNSGGGWGGWGGWGEPATSILQTIAFNLNMLKDTDNNFYFDDISWESAADVAVETTHESTDGHFTFDRTTNLRVRLFQDGFLPSVTVTRSYIQTSNNYTLPVISIVGDKTYFTDPKIGIDCDGDGTNGKTGNGQNQPKNYNQDWDRPVNFSYLSPDGQMLFNQDVNICVSGGYTRSQRYRSFKLKSNKVFDGQNRFDYPFFPQKPYIRSKTLLVRNGGNDIWSSNARFMDPALETIIQRSGIDLDVQSYVPIIEYVNGELRGVLNLREPNNDKFAYANWGYDDEELDAFENLHFKNGDDEAINRIFELGRNAADDDAYSELKQLLDIDEFTNYMATILFLHNDDWPDNNIKAYRSRNNGRYRFVSYDLDYAFGRCWQDSGDDPFANFVRFKDDSAPRTNPNKEIVNLFLNLLGRDDYRRQFIDTFCLVAGSVFEPSRSESIVNELLNNVQPMCQLMKQQNINDGHDPDRAANTIKSNLNGRSDKLTGYLKKFSYAKLSGTTRQAVTLNTDLDGQSTARLYVNGISVPYADFKGHLFAPVKLSAEAPAGYRFAGWKNGGTVVATESTIDLPEGTVTLTACFTPLDANELAKQGVTPVCVNEVSAANSIYVNDYFKRNDWVELYNTTDAPVDVAGMYLTDNLAKPKKYKITAAATVGSTVIPAHGYLIVWCDKLAPLSQLHASFKLGAEGGDVMLTAEDESWTSTITYPEHGGDQTVGRYPDGTANVYVMNIPTIAKTNLLSSYVINTKAGIDGDVNGDGTVDVGDVMAIINFMAGQPNGITLDRADVNGDGNVDVGDVMAVINIMAQ